MPTSHKVIAVTIDQRREKTSDIVKKDWIDDLQSLLNHNPKIAPTLIRKFQRTAGDETQGLIKNPASLVEILTLTQEHPKEWWIGIGVGHLERLEKTVNASDGKALRLARQAVNKAKKNRKDWGFYVFGEEAGVIEAVMLLLYGNIRHRSSEQWKYTQLSQSGMTATMIAKRSQKTQQTVSKLLQKANSEAESKARILLQRVNLDNTGEAQ